MLLFCQDNEAELVVMKICIFDEYVAIITFINNNNLYLPSAVFIAQVLVGPSIKPRKEIIQIENNMVKNPNWQEADQLAIYKRVRGVELGATEKQLQLVVRAGIEPGTTGFQVRRPNHSATLPPAMRLLLIFWSQYTLIYYKTHVSIKIRPLEQ